MIGLSPYVKEELLGALLSIFGNDAIVFLLADTIDQYPPMDPEWETPSNHSLAEELMTWRDEINWGDGGMYLCNDASVEIVNPGAGIVKYLAIANSGGVTIFVQPLAKPIDLSQEPNYVIFPEGSIKIYL